MLHALCDNSIGVEAQSMFCFRLANYCLFRIMAQLLLVLVEQLDLLPVTVLFAILLCDRFVMWCDCSGLLASLCSRRLSSLRWDVRHIEKNARKFNEDGTLISSCASILTSTLLQLIK